MPVFHGQSLTVMELSDAQRKLGIIPGGFMPAGGAAGQFLAKVTGADYDVAWVPTPAPTAGRGIVVTGAVIDFAQAAAYTPQAVPFATGAATMGFDPANFLYDITVPHLFLELATLGFGTHDAAGLDHDVIRAERTITTAWHPTGCAMVITRDAPADSAEWSAAGYFPMTTANNALNWTSAEAVMGVVAQGGHGGTGTCASLTGVRGTAIQANTGPVTNAYGGRFQVLAWHAGGTITTGAGIWIHGPTVTGTILTYYGIYLAAGAGNTVYGIYQVGTEPSFFNGQMVLGTPTFGEAISLRIQEARAVVTNVYGTYCNVTNTPAVDNPQYQFGGFFQVSTLGANNFTYAGEALTGVSGRAWHNGTGTCTGVYGGTFYSYKQNTGAVATLVGAFISMGNLNAVGAVTTLRGLYITTPDVTGAVNTSTHIYLAANAGTVQYGIYQVASGATEYNFFGGNTAIGATTFDPYIALRVERSVVTNLSGCYCVWADETNTPGAGTAQIHSGGYFAFNTASGNSFSHAERAVNGLIALGRHNGTGTATTVNGVVAHVNKANTGTVSNAVGVRGIIDNNNGGGTVTAAYVFFAQSPVVTGSFGAWYGVYIQASGVSSGYGVYQVGTGDDNYFAGMIAVGTATFSASIMVRTQKTFAITAAAVYGHYTDITQNPAGAQANVNYGGIFQLQTAGAQNFTAATAGVTGVVGSGYHNGTGTATSVIGGYFYGYKANTGAVTNLYGVYTQIHNTGAATAVTTGYGIFVGTPTTTSAITTYYGLYINTPAGTTAYGIAILGNSALNYIYGYTAIGTNAPVNTAWLLLGASTDTTTSLRIPRGTAAYAGTVEGDFWNDYTQKCLIGYIDGLKQFDTRTSFVQTETVTVTNTNVETTLFGAGVGGLIFPAAFFVVGKTVRLTLRGYHTMDATPPTITFRVKLGGVTLASVAYTDLNDSNRYFEINFLLTCRTTGAGGTVIGQGYILMYESGGSTTADLRELVMTGTAALDTTVARTLDVTAQPNAADAGSSTVITNATVEVQA